MDIPLSTKEQDAIDRRRAAEAARRERVLDAKNRTIGMDYQALAAQVAERKAQESNVLLRAEIQGNNNLYLRSQPWLFSSPRPFTHSLVQTPSHWCSPLILGAELNRQDRILQMLDHRQREDIRALNKVCNSLAILGFVFRVK